LNTDQIEKRIRHAVTATVKELSTVEQSLHEALEREARVYTVFNSSFLYRDKRSVKTNQSSRRLALKLTRAGGHPRVESISVIDGLSLKSHYRLLSGKDIQGLTPIVDAIRQELSSFGDLVFVLIGVIKGLRSSAQPCDGELVKEVRLAPAIKTSFRRVSAGVYELNRIMPLEDLIAHLAADLELEGGLSEDDRREVAKAYDSLLDAAITDVMVPKGETIDPTRTTLGKIVQSLRANETEYAAAVAQLQQFPEDQHELNEVLRIAYNFSTDVLPLIALFTSICDLKPLVFWCSLDKHWRLYQAFLDLPWSALGRKEKLEEYQAIIAEARNSAFHHVLPFDATIEVDLSGLDVRAEKIRLFSPYGKKQGRGVLLKDQELADVFAEFSRARQRPVSLVFWEKNRAVLKAACELADAVLESLIILQHARYSEDSHK
jgi:hypothetical protein